MDYKELEKELRIKYGRHRKSLSDPFELLDLVINYGELKDQEKEKAIQLAEEIYFNYNNEMREHNTNR